MIPAFQKDISEDRPLSSSTVRRSVWLSRQVSPNDKNDQSLEGTRNMAEVSVAADGTCIDYFDMGALRYGGLAMQWVTRLGSFGRHVPGDVLASRILLLVPSRRYGALSVGPVSSGQSSQRRTKISASSA